MTKVPDNVVFYDGVCNLCDSTVKFVIQRDAKKNFLFAQIGGENYNKLIEDYPKLAQVDSILFYHQNQLYTKSSAALKIVVRLGGFWHLMSVFWLVPKRLRDFIYGVIAKNRYKVFGRSESCIIPDRKYDGRFIN